MPVCIAGAPRSGTSMVTRLLHLCGMDLGPESDLMPPAPDNPDGFWENVRFVEINADILNAFGGAWDCPPALPNGWMDDACLAHCTTKAETLSETFAGHEPWGWKDPRNSLTLPFWLRLFPEMKVVVCLRNPLEVALSLYQRAWFSYELSISLWYRYNQRLLSAIPPDQRIVTHYDAYFQDARAELRRVIDFLDLPVPEQTLARSLSAVSLDLRHHRLTMQDVLDANVSPVVLDLYTQICAEAEVASGRIVHRAHLARAAASPGVLPARASGEADTDHTTVGQPAESGPTDSAPAPPRGLPADGAGRINRAALDVIRLRREVELLRPQLIVAQEAHQKLSEWARELEGRLTAAEDERQIRTDYIRDLEQQLTESHAEYRKLSTYARDLERQLTAVQQELTKVSGYTRDLERQVQADQQARQKMATYIRDLERQLLNAGAYARDLEQQLTDTRAAHEEVRDYVRGLERQLRADQEALAKTGAYAHDLEQQLERTRADHEQLAGYAATMARQLTAAWDDHARLGGYARDLEGALAAAHHDDRQPEAWTRDPTERWETAERERDRRGSADDVADAPASPGDPRA